MSNNYYSYPPVGGVPVYSTLSAFPTSTVTGALAVAADTGGVYEWNGSSWVLVGGPGFTANGITALTGDVTATGPGSVPATLATVNSNVGSFTNASITVNGKGLVTAASSGTTAVTTLGPFGSAPNANAGTITGSTLVLQPADASNPGGVSTTTQTFAGNKTFAGSIKTTFVGQAFQMAPSTATSQAYMTISNAIGTSYFGVDNQFGSQFSAGNYATVMSGVAGVAIQTNGATSALTALTIDTSGNAVFVAKVSSATANISSLSASQAVVTDASKNLVSLGYTSTVSNSNLVSRDTNGNSGFNNTGVTVTSTAATGQTITMSAGSTGRQRITGSGNITFNLPDCTTLLNGWSFYFNNTSSGTITLNRQDGTTLVATMLPGSIFFVACMDNSTVQGVWAATPWLTPSATSSTAGTTVPGSLTAATQLISSVATGTAPLSVSSTTLVPNLYVARAVLADSATTNANLTGDVTSVGNATTLAATSNGTLATLSGLTTVSSATTFSAAGTALTVTNDTTLSGRLSVLGAVSTASVVSISGTAPSGINQTSQNGVNVGFVANSSATSNVRGMGMKVTSGAAVTTAQSYQSNAPAATGGAITSFVDFVGLGGASHIATNNAVFSDTTGPSGNNFIYQSGTDPSILGGALTVSGAITANGASSQITASPATGTNRSQIIAANAVNNIQMMVDNHTGSFFGFGNDQPIIASTSSQKFVTNTGVSAAVALTLDTSQGVTMASLVGAGSRAVNASAAGLLSAASDSRLKQEVPEAPIPGLAEVMKLKPVAYKWLQDIENRGEDAATEVGFFADQVAPIIPSAAPMGRDGYYGFYDRSVTAALVKAVQELKAELDAYKAAHP